MCRAERSSCLDQLCPPLSVSVCLGCTAASAILFLPRWGCVLIFAQHTQAEQQALHHWVRGRCQVVEIGVAEGASALELREAMADDGTLYLINPFHWSRMKWINGVRRAARVIVGPEPARKCCVDRKV